MDQDTLETVNAAAGSIDMSLPAMFMHADIVVQTVMVLLALASVWCWAIIFEKWRRIRSVNNKGDKFEDAFWSGNSIEDLYEGMRSRADHPLAAVFLAAMSEWRRSTQGRAQVMDKLGLKDRVEMVMKVTLGREMQALERRTGFLATVGSTAPFVGLFGTVWGIMNSFKNIAAASNTSLAVVAPGIAEALFATALGLVAAIPAVIAYNKISSDLARYETRLQGFADEFLALLSRQLDERG